VKFGTGTGFAFGSAPKTDSGEKSGFSISGTSTDQSTGSKTGFSFGTTVSKTDDNSKSSEKSNDKTDNEASSGFSFGTTNKSDDKKPPSGFFGSSDASKTTSGSTEKSSGFTFGSGAIDKTASTGFSFGSKSEDSSNTSTGFSFGSANNKSSTGFPAFGSSNGSKDTAGFTFGSTPSTGFSFAAAGAAASQENKEAGGDTAAGDEDDEPPKVEVTQVVEEDAFHTVRCKLYYKKEKEFLEKGLGMLHLKKVEGGDTKTQLVVRAETNLGNILLNILVSDKMNVTKRKNNVQFVCVPNPPIKGMEGPVIMLVKVKDSLMADQLEEKLEEATKKT